MNQTDPAPRALGDNENGFSPKQIFFGPKIVPFGNARIALNDTRFEHVRSF